MPMLHSYHHYDPGHALQKEACLPGLGRNQDDIHWNLCCPPIHSVKMPTLYSYPLHGPGHALQKEACLPELGRNQEDVHWNHWMFFQAPPTTHQIVGFASNSRISALNFVFLRQTALRLSLLFVVQSLSCVQLFMTPWTAASQASRSFTISWRLLKLMSIELVMLSNHLVLCP